MQNVTVRVLVALTRAQTGATPAVMLGGVIATKSPTSTPVTVKFCSAQVAAATDTGVSDWLTRPEAVTEVEIADLPILS
ncbi:hypothetical protein D3C80_1971380 [compost metagenome]